RLDVLRHSLRYDKTGRTLKKLVSQPSIDMIVQLVDDRRPSGRSVENSVLSPTSGNLRLHVVILHRTPPTGGKNFEPYFVPENGVSRHVVTDCAYLEKLSGSLS